MDDCLNAIGVIDESGIGPQYQLALAVLRDELDRAGPLLRTCVKGALISKGDVRDWPIFREFRKSAIFLKEYKLLFKEDYNDIHPLLAKIQALDSIK